MGGATTAAAWVGIGADFGNPSMKAIPSCGFTSTLDTIFDTTSKLKTGGAESSQELSMKDRKREKEILSTGVLITHKDPLGPIERPPVLTRSRWKKRELGDKELRQSYHQPEQVMAIMKNYSTMPSALIFLTFIQKKSLGSLAGVRLDSRGSSICKSGTCGPRNRVFGDIFKYL